MHFSSLHTLLVLLIATPLGGCEQLGLPDAAKAAAAKEAEGKAIGGACRHSGRALEDCYKMNPKAQKSAVYAGWRDMDAYMRENNINAVTPDLVNAPGSKPPPPPQEEEENKGARHSAIPAGPMAPKPSRTT